jgi:hypothetical protein
MLHHLPLAHRLPLYTGLRQNHKLHPSLHRRQDHEIARRLEIDLNRCSTCRRSLVEWPGLIRIAFLRQ